MKRTFKTIFSGLLSLAISSANAGSSDILSLYKHAENYDAEIFSARSAYLAEREGESIALAAVFPTLNASVGSSRTNSNSELKGDDTYKTDTYSVSISQPLLNLPSWYNLSSAENNSYRAEAEYLSAQQNLILNVSTAYFNVLREQENLKSDKSQEAAVKRQYEQAKEQFEVGLIAITDVHEAQATFDSSKTNRIRSEGNLIIAKENLSRITGQVISDLSTLKPNFPIVMDDNYTSEQWVESALELNLDIKIAHFALKKLNADMKSNKAQHLPRLNLDANYGVNKFDNFTTSVAGFSNPEEEQSSISINLDIPLYSGGATQARVRQARHLVEQARHNLSSTQRKAQISARTEYLNLKTNIQTIESLGQNIVSRKSALEATKEGYNVGTRNIVEVLDAERNYFTSLRDHAIARFDFIESSLRIKQAAGILNRKDLEVLNAWLN